MAREYCRRYIYPRSFFSCMRFNKFTEAFIQKLIAMKSALKLVLSFSFLLFFSGRMVAQSFETAGDYMDYIYKANNALTQKYLTYLSAVSHGKSARKVEKRR